MFCICNCEQNKKKKEMALIEKFESNFNEVGLGANTKNLKQWNSGESNYKFLAHPPQK